MRKMVFVAVCVAMSGCVTSTPTVKAPKDMVGTVTAIRQEVSDCFKANRFTDQDIRCKVQVSLKSADAGDWKGIPLFNSDGVVVGGITWGMCGGNSAMQIGQRADGFWSDAVLRHELCHSEDFCLICDPDGHPLRYRSCCPHWPYLGSQAMAVGEVTADVHEGMFCFMARVSSNEYVTAMVPESGIGTARVMDIEWYRKVADRMRK